LHSQGDDKTTIAKFILRLEEECVVYREIDQDEKESNGYTLLKKEWN